MTQMDEKSKELKYILVCYILWSVITDISTGQGSETSIQLVFKRAED